jgi:acetyl esterase/lipase
MSKKQLDFLVRRIRVGGLDMGAPVAQVRAVLEDLHAAIPAPENVSFRTTKLGDVEALESTTPQSLSTRIVLYVHGGAFAFGSVAGYSALSSTLAGLAGARGLSISYRLAPEDPFPSAITDAVAAYKALLDNGISPGHIAIAGDSAGGGLAVAMLIASRDSGLPMPAAAVLLSPWVDLALEGESMRTKAVEDPSLTERALRARADDYLNGADPRTPLASPIHADLTGLPPLLIQVGSAEILLSDAIRLAGRAGAGGVHTRLEVWPNMIHVFQMFDFMLDEGRAALKAAGRFLCDAFADHEGRQQVISAVAGSPGRSQSAYPFRAAAR